MVRDSVSELDGFATSCLEHLRSLPFEDWRNKEGPTASLKSGAAGVAFALWRASALLDDPDLLAQADDWRARAVAESAWPRAFSGDGTEARRDSLFSGEAGVHFVSALVSGSLDAQAARDDSLQALARSAPAPDASLEFLDGAAGHLAAYSMLVSEIEAPGAKQSGSEMARRIVGAAFKNGDGSAPWKDMPSFAFARGRAGVYFSLIQWADASGEPLPDWFLPGLKSFARAGREGGDPRFSASWCGGAAGLALLWTKAFEHFKDEIFRDAALKAAEEAAGGADALSDLCCGSGGRAYALLAASRLDARGPWKDRAVHLASLSLDRRARAASADSLLKGQAGLLCLALDILKAGRPRFPAVES